MLNVVNFCGHLVRQPVTHQTQNGSLVAMDVAINETYNGVERATFVHCIVFGAVGEACAKYLVKGQEVTVEGRLTSNTRTMNDGSKRTELGVIAHRVHFGRKPTQKSQPEVDQVEDYEVEPEPEPTKPVPKRGTAKKAAGKPKPQ